MINGYRGKDFVIGLGNCEVGYLNELFILILKFFKVTVEFGVEEKNV